jgi:hypothetical protein
MSELHAANLLQAYHSLADDVNRALYTQLGDDQRLGIHRSAAVSLAGALEQASIGYL